MILAADVGGTKSVFASVSGEPGSVMLASVTRYENEAFATFGEALRRFADDVSFGPIETLSIAVAGPVNGSVCRMTNTNWVIDAGKIAKSFDVKNVFLLNDLQSAAYGLSNLGADSFESITDNAPYVPGNRIIVSPGTGLGESIIVYDDGQYKPVASEGGHADFAPIDGLSFRLWAFLRKSGKRVSVEDVLSGPGLFNIYSFLMDDAGENMDESIIMSAQPGAIITDRGLDHKDEIARRTLMLFLDLLAAEAGNMALKTLAVGGAFIGGGIIPRLVSILDKKRFCRIFCDKGKHREWLRRIAIQIIINTELPIYGAAEYALKNRRYLHKF